MDPGQYRVTRKIRRKKQGRVKQKEFMDAAQEAWVRSIAEDLWSEVEQVRQRGLTGAAFEQATAWIQGFQDRSPYEEIWQRMWQEHATPYLQDPEPGTAYAAVEEAVAEAVSAEEAARQARGDQSVFDTPEYQGFVSRALNKLLQEADGEIEETF